MRTEISELEQLKKDISDTVRALVVSTGCYSTVLLCVCVCSPSSPVSPDVFLIFVSQPFLTVQERQEIPGQCKFNYRCSSLLLCTQSVLVLLSPVTSESSLFVLQLPEYTQALQRGRDIRNRLNQLFSKETELDEEHYSRALRLPNTTHPDVVSTNTHKHTPFFLSICEKICKSI